MTRIIGLAGHMGSGKDTVAKILSHHGYRRTAFADALRNELAMVIIAKQIPRDVPFYIRRTIFTMPADELWQKPTTVRCRRLLQWWGTEYRRSVNPDYWIDIVRADIAAGLWTISDVRFPNEAKLVHDLGGEIWRVDRDALFIGGIPNHVSERVASLPVDRIIDNNGTLDDLWRVVNESAEMAA